MSKKSNRPENLSGTARRLLRMTWKYKIRLITACLCMMVSSAAVVRGTYYLKPMVNNYFVPLIGQTIKDASFVKALSAAVKGGDHLLSGAARILILMAGFYLVSSAASLIESQLMVSLGNQVMFDLRTELYDRVLSQPLDAVLSQPAGALISSFTNDMDSLNNMIRRSLPYLINGTVTCLTILATMIGLHVRLTLVMLACTCLMLPVMSWLAKRSMKHAAARQVCMMELTSKAREYTQSQELIRTLGMEDTARQQFSEKNARLFEHAFRADAFSHGIFCVTNGLSRIGYAVVLMAGSAMALSGSTDIGTVAVFMQYYNSFYKPLTDMTKQISNVLSALAGAERIFRVLDVEPEKDDGDIVLTGWEKPVSGGNTLSAESDGSRSPAWKTEDGMVPLRGELILEELVFGYIPGKQVLRGISLTIQPGETVALLGTTGAGKTTVISLINRLYEPEGGSIRLDGIPVTRIRKESLRHAVTTVPQDTSLFTGTVAENLRYGKPDANQEELWKILRLVGADFFVEHLPRGLDTMLDRGGENLSQGERQLLSIARAAASDAPILILDEATSSIDTYTERKISQAFDRLMSGRTVLVIAHRLSTVQNADRIVILDGGKIAECGTPGELIRRKGYYYRLLHADEV